MRPAFFSTAILASLCWSAPGFAHEYWLEPLRYVLKEPGALVGNLKNGQLFKSSNYTYITNYFEFFTVTGPGGTWDVSGRNGDRPALRHEVGEPGLYSVSYQGKFDKITFRNADKITEYFDYEGLTGALQRHLARGLSAAVLEEKYARSAKALFQVGEVTSSGRGDGLTGLTFELVAEKNPYTLENGDALPVRLYYKGEVVPDTQIRIFRFDGKLENTTTRTDGQGRAFIPLKNGGKFLLNAVRLYEGDEDPGTEIPEWYSDWASLVFGMADTDAMLKRE